MDRRAFRIMRRLGRIRKKCKQSRVGLLTSGVVLLLVLLSLVIHNKATATPADPAVQPSHGSVLPATHKVGYLGGVILGVASSWLEKEVASQNFRTISDGLQCFDAIGGPKPEDIVEYVKKRTQAIALQDQLIALMDRLSTEPRSPNGAAACASWILNG